MQVDPRESNAKNNNKFFSNQNESHGNTRQQKKQHQVTEKRLPLFSPMTSTYEKGMKK